MPASVVSASEPVKIKKSAQGVPVLDASEKVQDPTKVLPETETIVSEVVSPVLSEQPKLSVQSVRFRKAPTGGAVLIEGVLKNASSKILTVPEKIYARAYGKEGKMLFEKEIYLPSGDLYPEMEQAFFGTYTSMKEEEIQWVDVVLEK